ncbi:hypothetical protein BC938DRAFT_476357 [Jimgerdemannia flammicorona]|uniref:Uncharacterized protein n=1 Tax=Jimgerdemannia flammicorona TaxID=994334 RepID=A0A433QQK1_9FUNG|nr:hypothetical protein BC938DRAFT_476357 [Jimgerdemannia flammicorona]
MDSNNPGYGYCENIGDGRGFTSGYVGFTSGTDDAYSLIKNYTTQMPDNALSAFIQPLATISSLSICDTAGRNNTAQLSGYCGAWQTEACHSDSAFRNLEIAFATDMYLIPSTRFAALVGITTNLGKAIFYDTIIQHGWRYVEPKINIWRIINLTGAMLANESEATYLTRFLTTRRQLQCCYPYVPPLYRIEFLSLSLTSHFPLLRDNVWPFSADRSSDLMSLVNDWTANKDLANPVFLAKAAVTVTGNEDTNSDKTNCNGKSSTASLLTAGSARAIITANVWLLVDAMRHGLSCGVDLWATRVQDVCIERRHSFPKHEDIGCLDI